MIAFLDNVTVGDSLVLLLILLGIIALVTWIIRGRP